MSEISPRPWKLSEKYSGQILDADGKVIFINDLINPKPEDEEHIVNCVNEQVELPAYLQQLQNLYQSEKLMAEKAEAEVNIYKEALRNVRNKYCEELNLSTCGRCKIIESCLELGDRISRAYKDGEA